MRLVLLVTAVDADRAAVRAELANVEQPQTVRCEYPPDRRKRKIREVLVIDRIELIQIHELHEMRELERRDSALREQLLHAGDEIVEVGHVGEHVVAEDQLRGSVRGAKIGRGLLAEKADDGRNSLGDSRVGRALRGLDAETLYVASHEMLEQISVVARDLHDERIPTDAVILHHVVDRKSTRLNSSHS